MVKHQVISINISTGTYKDFVTRLIEMSGERSTYTCVANVHMLVEAHKDKAFSAIVNNAELVTPDGMPLVWGLKLLHRLKQERVAGSDLLPDLLREAELHSIPVYFYGGTEAMISKIETALQPKYPALKIAGLYSPPFRPLTGEEEQAVIERINGSGAKIVFVVLGCPKQEKWMSSMKGKINAAMIGVGAALPVMIGLQARAPKWMQKAGLEWFFRLCQEPRRLIKRYTITNTLFLFLLMKEKFQSKRRKVIH
ncbi:MAG TPA: WecB/TagA/CpsF family glycosyltransferase [Chitinophagaceae bacterium]|nr:WecB/TagA/CpsF family glycosyltransferase [Chitinophagaceae bacterium]